MSEDLLRRQQLVSPGDNSGSPILPPLQPPSRSISLSDVVSRPHTVPEKLDFKQLEKFEGNHGNNRIILTNKLN